MQDLSNQAPPPPYEGFGHTKAYERNEKQPFQQQANESISSYGQYNQYSPQEHPQVFTPPTSFPPFIESIPAVLVSTAQYGIFWWLVRFIYGMFCNVLFILLNFRVVLPTHYEESLERKVAICICMVYLLLDIFGILCLLFSKNYKNTEKFQIFLGLTTLFEVATTKPLFASFYAHLSIEIPIYYSISYSAVVLIVTMIPLVGLCSSKNSFLGEIFRVHRK